MSPERNLVFLAAPVLWSVRAREAESNLLFRTAARLAETFTSLGDLTRCICVRRSALRGETDAEFLGPAVKACQPDHHLFIIA